MATTILLGSLQLKADEAQCRAVLHDCDVAVTALQKENALQKQIIVDEETRFNTEHKELQNEQLWKPIAIAGVTVSLGAVLLLVINRK